MAKGRKSETSSQNDEHGGVLDTVRGLAEIVTQHGLTELVVDVEGATITLRRGTVVHASAPAPVTPAPLAHAHTPFATHAHTPAPAAAPAAPEKDNGHLVTSPFVGTFYRRPNPDSPTYVNVNEKVEKGAVLCIVEAMKLMNEIEADIAGTIVAVLAEDGSVVEYGQPLFKISPA